MEKTADPNTDSMNFNDLDAGFDYLNFNSDPFMESFVSDFHLPQDGFDEEDSSSSSWNTFSPPKKISDSTTPGSSLSASILKSVESKGKRKKEKDHKSSVGFRVKTSMEVLDDGYRWRKYGKKPIRGTPHPRHYHKCSNEGCTVKKKVERDREDSSYVKITYDGTHNHEIPSVVYCEAHDVTTLMPQNSLVFTNLPSS